MISVLGQTTLAGNEDGPPSSHTNLFSFNVRGIAVTTEGKVSDFTNQVKRKNPTVR
jgi:hypothetical protein